MTVPWMGYWFPVIWYQSESVEKEPRRERRVWNWQLQHVPYMVNWSQEEPWEQSSLATSKVQFPNVESKHQCVAKGESNPSSDDEI